MLLLSIFFIHSRGPCCSRSIVPVAQRERLGQGGWERVLGRTGPEAALMTSTRSPAHAGPPQEEVQGTGGFCA